MTKLKDVTKLKHSKDKTKKTLGRKFIYDINKPAAQAADADPSR